MKSNRSSLGDNYRKLVVANCINRFGDAIEAIHPFVTIVFTLFVSTVEAFRVPAGNAFIAIVVTDDQYEEAISKNTSFTTIASLLGTAVAGAIIALLGTTVAIIMDAITFFYRLSCLQR